MFGGTRRDIRRAVDKSRDFFFGQISRQIFGAVDLQGSNEAPPEFGANSLKR
jgi:hypothetical protein